MSGRRAPESCEIIRNRIREELKNCHIYVFEICSVKLQQRDGFQVQGELTRNYIEQEQTKEEFMADLEILYQLVTPNIPIVFQCHFRPNIIYFDDKKAITNREFIFDMLSQFARNKNNVVIHDPSVFIQKNHTLFNGEQGGYHLTTEGHRRNFEILKEIAIDLKKKS